MILFVAFLISAAIFRALASRFLGFPLTWVSPAPLETITAIKRVEFLLYFVCVFGIPAFSALIAHALDLKEKRRRKKATTSLKKRNLEWLWWVVIPFFIFVFTPRYDARGSIAQMDEGLRLGAANQSLHLKSIYKEIYVLYGPAIDVWQPRVAFALFGKTVAAIRALEWIIEPFGAISLFWLSLVVFRRRWPSVFLLLVMGMRNPPFWITPRAALPLLALAAIYRSLEQTDVAKIRWWGLMAGLLTSAGFLYSKEAGCFPPIVIGSTLVILLFQAIRREEKVRPLTESSLAYVAGIALLGLPFIGTLVLNGALKEFVENSFLVSTSVLSAWAKPSPPVMSTLNDLLFHPWNLFAYQAAPARWWFPVVLYMASLAYGFRCALCRRGGSADPSLFLLAFGGVFFFVIALGRSDYDHWLKATPLYWLLLILWIERLMSFGPEERRFNPDAIARGAMRCVTALALAKLAWGFGRWEDLAYKATHRSPWPSPFGASPLPSVPRLGPLRLPNAELTAIRTIVDRIRTYVPEGKPLWILGDEGAYYFLADRANPTRYANISFIFTFAMSNDVIRDLERTPPACILIPSASLGMVVHAAHRPLSQWIQNHYHLTESVANHSFLIPK